MKLKYLALPIVFLSIILSFSSCFGDLDTTPIDPNLYTPDKAYSTPESYMQGLAKLYAALGLSGQNGPASAEIVGVDAGTSPFLRTFWYMQEFTTDEVTFTQSDPGCPELSYNTYTTEDNPIIAGLYYRLLFTITMCNDYLKQTTDGKLSDRGVDADLKAKIQSYRAEARFLRAMMYYHAMDMFGNVPFVTEDDPIGAYLPPQISRSDLFRYVESELIGLDNDSDMIAPRQNEYGRADKAAVWLLLSRLYLNAETYIQTPKYDECVKYAKNVMNAGYGLCPNYAELFMADNGENMDARKEMIFTINFDGRWTQSYATQFLVAGSRGPNDPNFTVTSGSSKSFKGSRATLSFVRHFYPEIDDLLKGVNEVIDDANGTLGKKANERDNRAIFFTHTCHLPMSLNAGSSTFIYGWPSYKWTNLTRKGIPPYYVDESGNTIALTEYPSLDYPLMRLAEAYLNYAEAVARKSGGTSTEALALEKLNELRDRANIKADDLTTFDLNYIFSERSRELHWEAFRRTDLIRFDRYAGNDYTWEFKNGTFPGSAVPKYRELFPIPAKDIGANPNLVQNPGYGSAQ
ncbi:RagB/SusD family nutrient uptake outer membrane protein [Dysgonomonas reticulitermitis]